MRIASRWVEGLAMLLLPWVVVEAQGVTDLSLTNTASPSPVQAMTPLTYSMNIFNHGPTVVATHLRPSSQEVFDGHEGLLAAKVKSGEPFFLRLSKYLTSL